jgi:hypothetical protein
VATPSHPSKQLFPHPDAPARRALARRQPGVAPAATAPT